MTNLTYVGTHLNNGQPDNSTSCVTGFDQAGFVMGTSSSLFNQIVDQGMAVFGDADSGLFHIIDNLLSEIETRNEDVANWPNPFFGIKNSTFQDANSRWLELIDGGSNLENVPMGPMLVKARGVDVLVAVDGSADDKNSWPNGTAPIWTNRRLKTYLTSSHQQFPPIPENDTDFVNFGVRGRPTFFGCNPTQPTNPEWPLVIYLPNSPPINGDNPASNAGTFQLKYSPLHTRTFLDQVHTNTISGFTPNSNSPDPNWGKCLQCAAVDRARMQLSPAVARSAICTSCFNQYCYDPSNPPSSSQLPNRKLEFVNPDDANESFFKRHEALILGLSIGLGLLFLVISPLICFCWFCRRRRQKSRYARAAASEDSSYPLTHQRDTTLASKK